MLKNNAGVQEAWTNVDMTIWGQKQSSNDSTGTNIGGNGNVGPESEENQMHQSREQLHKNRSNSSSSRGRGTRANSMLDPKVAMAFSNANSENTPWGSESGSFSGMDLGGRSAQTTMFGNGAAEGFMGQPILQQQQQQQQQQQARPSKGDIRRPSGIFSIDDIKLPDVQPDLVHQSSAISGTGSSSSLFGLGFQQADPMSIKSMGRSHSESFVGGAGGELTSPKTPTHPQSPNQNSPGGTNASSSIHNLYKTELCRSWEETGSCRYGTKCQFAHGRNELRPIARHPKYKTEICRTFATSGTCPYGTRCRFIHYVTTKERTASASEDQGGDASSNDNTGVATKWSERVMSSDSVHPPQQPQQPVQVQPQSKVQAHMTCQPVKVEAPHHAPQPRVSRQQSGNVKRTQSAHPRLQMAQPTLQPSASKRLPIFESLSFKD